MLPTPRLAHKRSEQRSLKLRSHHCNGGGKPIMLEITRRFCLTFSLIAQPASGGGAKRNEGREKPKRILPPRFRDGRETKRPRTNPGPDWMELDRFLLLCCSLFLGWFDEVGTAFALLAFLSLAWGCANTASASESRSGSGSRGKPRWSNSKCWRCR